MKLNISVQQPKWGVNYDVGFSAFVIRKYGFVSHGIQWFSAWDSIKNIPSPSHALTITGENETVEAFSHGVDRGTVSAYLDDEDCVLLVRRPLRWTPDMGQRIKRQVETHIGEKYGFRLIGALAVANSYSGKLLDLLSGKRFSGWLARLADSKKEMICSESVSDGLAAQPEVQAFGILARPPAVIKPVDLCGDRYIYEPPDYAVELVR